MDKYIFFEATAGATFEQGTEEILRNLSSFLDSELETGRHLVCSKVFLSDMLNQHDELLRSRLHRELSRVPCSVVGQAPLSGAKLAVLLMTAESDSGRLFKSVRLSAAEAADADAYWQTIRLFEKYKTYLDAKSLDIRIHLVRTWLYISNIDITYAQVVKARNDFFRQCGLTVDTHLVASTGIGAENSYANALVGIDFLAYDNICEEDKKYLKAPDLLNATHEYGVAFERATRVVTPCGRRIYVSGTASIDNLGQVVYPGDVRLQVDRLLRNIQGLLNDGGACLVQVSYFIVYVRDIADRGVVERMFKLRFPHTPSVIVHAKVCRPGWLVEAECVINDSDSNRS